MYISEVKRKDYTYLLLKTECFLEFFNSSFKCLRNTLQEIYSFLGMFSMTSHDKHVQIGLSEVSSEVYERDRNHAQPISLKMV